MKIRGIETEDFINYKYPSMFIAIGNCDWKCCVEGGFPRHPGLPGEEHRGFPAPLPLSPFYHPDLDRRVDSPALSGRGSRPSGRTSG